MNSKTRVRIRVGYNDNVNDFNLAYTTSENKLIIFKCLHECIIRIMDQDSIRYDVYINDINDYHDKVDFLVSIIHLDFLNIVSSIQELTDTFVKNSLALVKNTLTSC